MVKTEEFTKSEAFLDALSLRADRFRDYGLGGDWIFRGHSDATWKLVPSALRENPNPMKEYFHSPNLTIDGQFEMELLLLRRFFDVADSCGLSIPEDTQLRH